MNNFLAWIGVLMAVAAPFIAFAIFVHGLEKIGQRQLAQRFGWKSVMWTGWLGTPIHELSHVVMCLLFRHRVDEVALFEPDEKSGRLGYVRHSYRSNSWFEELGNPFIAVAPLFGGSMVLLILVKVFFGESSPDLPQLPGDSIARESSMGMLESVRQVLGNVFRPEHFAQMKFWVFVYLVLCVGSHMAPSRSDYRGAGKGTLIIVSALATAIVVLGLISSPPQDLLQRLVDFFSPLFAMFITIALLLSFTTFLISLLVQIFPRKYVVRNNK